MSGPTKVYVINPKDPKVSANGNKLPEYLKSSSEGEEAGQG